MSRPFSLQFRRLHKHCHPWCLNSINLLFQQLCHHHQWCILLRSPPTSPVKQAWLAPTMRPPSVGPDDDCHQDRSTQYINSNSALLQKNSQQQSPKIGAWGDDIRSISDEDVWFVFQKCQWNHILNRSSWSTQVKDGNTGWHSDCPIRNQCELAKFQSLWLMGNSTATKLCIPSLLPLLMWWRLKKKGTTWWDKYGVQL